MLNSLLNEVCDCRVCADVLPLGPRPDGQISAMARFLIASQAPGRNAHESGIPFSEVSGDRLRQWMDVSTDEFCDEVSVAILPMGLCYPGCLLRGGNARPRSECAALWRGRLLQHMHYLRLTLLVGAHAQAGAQGPGTMTERVKGFCDYLPMRAHGHCIISPKRHN